MAATPACNLVGKNPNGDFSSSGGQTGGGTTTGNALARALRVVSFLPYTWATGSQTVRLTVIGVRAQIDGVWHERLLMLNNVFVQPSGIVVASWEGLNFPSGRYEEVRMMVTNAETSNEGGTFHFSTNESVYLLEIKFTGSVVEDGSGVGLSFQRYADNLSTIASNSELVAQLAATTGDIVPPDSGTPNHLLFVALGATSGPGGVAALDNHCAAHAQMGVAQGHLPADKTWRALVSLNALPARDRVPLQGNVYNVDPAGFKLIATANDFWDPERNWRASQGFDYIGTTTAGAPVWTGTETWGATAAMGTCDDWENPTSGLTVKGGSDLSSLGRINSLTTNCADSAGLYCISE